MNDKEAVRTIERNACIEKHPTGWLVLKHPNGRALGGGSTPARAWKAARMRLFHEGIMEIISSGPAIEKGIQ